VRVLVTVHLFWFPVPMPSTPSTYKRRVSIKPKYNKLSTRSGVSVQGRPYVLLSGTNLRSLVAAEERALGGKSWKTSASRALTRPVSRAPKARLEVRIVPLTEALRRSLDIKAANARSTRAVKQLHKKKSTKPKAKKPTKPKAKKPTKPKAKKSTKPKAKKSTKPTATKPKAKKPKAHKRA